MGRYMNSAILVLIAVVTAGYEAGLISASNAFFGALAAAVVTLGDRFAQYEGATFGHAAREILSGPAGHDDDAFGYLFFVGIMALSTVLLLQVGLGY